MCDIGPMPWGDGVVDVEDLKVQAEYIGKDVDDPSLIAHWALDEVDGDIAWESAAENNGIVSDSATWQPENDAIGGALHLDGITAYVATPSILSPADVPFSALLWIRGNTLNRVVLSQCAGQNWLAVDPAGALMTALKGTGRRAKDPYSDVMVVDDQWHRLGLTWDGTTRSLYVDNALAASDEPGSLSDLSEGLNIGAGADLAPGTFFSGLIDDVRI